MGLLFFKKNSKPIFLVGSFSVIFDGNALEFLRSASKDSRLEIFGVVRNRSELLKLRDSGLKAVLFGGFKEFLLLRLADAVFSVGYVHTDFSHYPSSKCIRILLWHNMPLKAMGRLNKPMPDKVDEFDAIVCTSDFTKFLMKESFGSINSKLIMTGQPKTDRLFAKHNFQNISKKLSSPPPFKIVAYMPTWRQDFKHSKDGDFAKNSTLLESTLSSLNASQELMGTLRDANAMLLVKPHGFDDIKKITSILSNNSDLIRIITDDQIESIDLVREADVIVTDYSGILVDRLILAKPVISYVYDYYEYWGNRGSPLFNYSDVFASIIAFNLKDLNEMLGRYLNFPDDNQKELLRLREIMHFYVDDQASKRIIDEALTILDNK